MKSKPTNYTDRNNKFKSLMVNVLRILRAIRLSILGSLLFLGSAQADHLSFSAKEKIIAKIHERTKTRIQLRSATVSEVLVLKKTSKGVR